MAPARAVVRLLVVTGGKDVEEDPQPPRWAVWVARVVAVLVVVPVRLAWEWIKAVGWAVRRLVLRPLAGVLRRVWTAGGALARFVWRRVFVPVGAGVRWVFGVLGVGLRAFGRGLMRYLIRPTGALLRVVADLVGRGFRALGSGVRRGFGKVGRALAALGRAIRDAFTWAGRRVALPLWRLLKQAFRTLVVTPARWTRRTVLTPAAQLTRRTWQAAVIAPARHVRISVIKPVQLAGHRVRSQLRAAFGSRRDWDAFDVDLRDKVESFLIRLAAQDERITAGSRWTTCVPSPHDHFPPVSRNRR
jgi:hypothetical protein